MSSASTTPAAAIEIRGLVKHFKRKRRGRQLLTPWKRLPKIEALCGVDLSVAPGELLTLLGPNGAGKTTLLKVVATLVSPTEGEVYVQGTSVSDDPIQTRRRVGYVLADERSFYWRLSCRDNLRFFAALQGLSPKRAAGRVEELAALLGLSEQLERDFADLSTGQRQRMAIARGLLADPPVLLFDEATRSLDPGRSDRLRKIIRSVLVERERKAVLFATHDLTEARELADRVVLMRAGRVASQGSFDAVAQEIREVFAKEAEDEAEEFRRLFPALAGEASP